MVTIAGRVYRSHSVKALSIVSLLFGIGLACLNPIPAAARELAVVKPVMDCGALANMVLTDPEASGRIETAVLKQAEPVPPTTFRLPNGHVIHAQKIATPVAKPRPYCDVNGYVIPQVHFELHLPTGNWTQRLLFEGCGAFCGSVHLINGAWAADGCRVYTNGEFATVTSDLGHSSTSMTDAIWGANRELREDFGFRGVHVTAIAAKEIIARFYGRPQAFAYFDGCSDGGREAMVSVERYPADFNGVIAGAPVFNEVANNTIYHAWGVQHLINSDGSLVLSDAALVTLHKAALAACGTYVGDPKEDLILDPTQCHFDPSVTACKENEAADNCLTPQQIKVAHEMYIGPHDPEGRPLYYGYDVGSELGWNSQAEGDATWGTGSFPGYLASSPPNPRAEFQNVAFTREAVEKDNVFASQLDALDTDLLPLEKAGAKLIIWQGWVDVAVATRPTINFYHAVREKLGPAETDNSIRLYMLPGVNHCGIGVGPHFISEGPNKMEVLSAIMAWVEDGVAPGPMTAVKNDPITGAVTAKLIIQPYQ